MRKNPRSPVDRLFNKELWFSSLLRGFVLLIAVACVYIISLWRGQGETDARTLVITTLILSNTLLIYLSRGPDISFYTKIKTKPNSVIKWISAASLVMLAAALYLPDFRHVLRFSFLHSLDIVICVTIALLNTLLSELVIHLTKFKATGTALKLKST